MAWTQTDVDNLREAIALGATRVRIADRDVTYRSLDEMRSLLREMEAQVAGTKRVRQIRVYSAGKGFC